MKTHTLTTTVVLPQPLEQVFSFFAEANNLEALTPSFLKFRVKTPTPIEMRSGALIDYSLKVRGIPLRWQSEITEWNPPHSFVDVQRRGPYRLWHHEHRFEAAKDGTRVTDNVRYAVPFDALTHRFLVAPDLQRIFAFRLRQMQIRFGAVSGDPGRITIDGKA